MASPDTRRKIQAVRKIQAAFRSVKGGVFTNTSGLYALTKPRVTSKLYVIKVGGGLDLNAIWKGNLKEIPELLGYTLIGTKPKVRISSNGKVIGQVPETITRWQFHVPKVKAYIVISKSGTIKINTPGPWEQVVLYLTKNFYPGLIKRKLDVNLAKVDARFYVNHEIDISNFYRELSRLPKSLIDLGHEPDVLSENSMGLKGGFYFKWLQPVCSFHVFTSGTIIVNGLKTDTDMSMPSRIFKDILSRVNIERALILNTPLKRPGLSRKQTKENKAKYMAQMRYARAASYTNTRSGFYVRPGPNGVPRFYPVPSNVSLVREKTIKAYAAAKVNIPKSVRNILGVAENAQPREKNGKPNGPKNFSNKHANYYVRPDRQGKPKWYAIPKHKGPGRDTVTKAYKAAGINIPPHIRELFGISNSNSKFSNTKTNHTLLNRSGELYINGKQASRYEIQALVRIARNLEIAQVNSTMTKDTIIAWIKSRASNSKQAINLTLNGVKHIFMKNGSVRRIQPNKSSRSRQFSSLSTAEQNKIARAYLGNSNFNEAYKKLSPKERYAFILWTKDKGGPAPVNTTGTTVVLNENNNANLIAELMNVYNNDNYVSFPTNT